MSEHKVRVGWERNRDDFDYETYTRDHKWSFPGGVVMNASAAPGYLGNSSHVDPEEAFVASLSSCHMLTFLAIAAKKRFIVDRYADDATGILDKNAEGILAVTQVTLRPHVVFGGENRPTAEQVQRLHDSAHKHCFIANSVTTQVIVESQGAQTA